MVLSTMFALCCALACFLRAKAVSDTKMAFQQAFALKSVVLALVGQRTPQSRPAGQAVARHDVSSWRGKSTLFAAERPGRRRTRARCFMAAKGVHAAQRTIALVTCGAFWLARPLARQLVPLQRVRAAQGTLAEQTCCAHRFLWPFAGQLMPLERICAAKYALALPTLCGG